MQQRQPVRIKSPWFKSNPEMLLRSLQSGLVIGGWICFYWNNAWRMQAILPT